MTTSATPPTAFSPMDIRGISFPNRVWVSPMCQYSAPGDGIPRDWHRVHYGALSVGGAGLVMAEATAVSPEGRISTADVGLWNVAQREAWRPIVDFAHEQGTLMGVQLGHAGRKASTQVAWQGPGYVEPKDGGWETVGPSRIAYGQLPEPRPLLASEIQRIIETFATAAERAVEAGFDVIELHGAHGYLLHQFMSPLANERDDDYGGSFEARTRLTREVVGAVRSAIPSSTPLFIRVSATDWVDGGWAVNDTVRLAGEVQQLGVDLIDVSSGALHRSKQQIDVGPAYQVPLAREVKVGANMPVAAVGILDDPSDIDDVFRRSDADAVFLGRPFLRNPRHAAWLAQQFDAEVTWPPQYLRGRTPHQPVSVRS